MPHANIIRDVSARSDLVLKIVQQQSAQEKARAIVQLAGAPQMRCCGIVYVNSRRETEQVQGGTNFSTGPWVPNPGFRISGSPVPRVLGSPGPGSIVQGPASRVQGFAVEISDDFEIFKYAYELTPCAVFEYTTI